ncbi:uncharacterized protein DS421_9g262060 [Arachis hypogaea]|nr:uncharacterized protein DS421_9g262060 [Arachis hypogaea]
MMKNLFSKVLETITLTKGKRTSVAVSGDDVAWCGAVDGGGSAAVKGGGGTAARTETPSVDLSLSPRASLSLNHAGGNNTRWRSFAQRIALLLAALARVFSFSVCDSSGGGKNGFGGKDPTKLTAMTRAAGRQGGGAKLLPPRCSPSSV